jgi:hypothetical protein
MFLLFLAKQTPETFSPVFVFLQFSAADFVGKQIMNQTVSTQIVPQATIKHGRSVIDAAHFYINVVKRK